MINLEQVKLLEKKVAKAVDYVERLTKENTALHQQKTELQTKLDSYQKRIEELEVLVVGFKEDQNRIEEGILAALDRLSQFEKAMEKSLKEKPVDGSTAGRTCFEIPDSGDDPDPLGNTANAEPPSADGAPSIDGKQAGELEIF